MQKNLSLTETSLDRGSRLFAYFLSYTFTLYVLFWGVCWFQSPWRYYPAAVAFAYDFIRHLIVKPTIFSAEELFSPERRGTNAKIGYFEFRAGKYALAGLGLAVLSPFIYKLVVHWVGLGELMQVAMENVVFRPSLSIGGDQHYYKANLEFQKICCIVTAGFLIMAVVDRSQSCKALQREWMSAGRIINSDVLFTFFLGNSFLFAAVFCFSLGYGPPAPIPGHAGFGPSFIIFMKLFGEFALFAAIPAFSGVSDMLRAVTCPTLYSKQLSETKRVQDWLNQGNNHG